MKISILLISMIALIISTTYCYTCPSLTCDVKIGDSLCFSHPNESPVFNTIKTYSCDNGNWCNLEYGEFSWVKAS